MRCARSTATLGLARGVQNSETSTRARRHTPGKTQPPSTPAGGHSRAKHAEGALVSPSCPEVHALASVPRPGARAPEGTLHNPRPVSHTLRSAPTRQNRLAGVAPRAAESAP